MGDDYRGLWRSGLVQVEVLNVTKACENLGNPPKKRTNVIKSFIVHHHGTIIKGLKKELVTAVDLARLHGTFKTLRRATGRMPYHFVVGRRGELWQAVRMQ